MVYDELRNRAAQKLAGEQPGQTLQATALVHEPYLRLVGKDAALLLAGYEGMKMRQAKISPQAKVRIPEAIARLAGLYEATDKRA